jgi:hypothetical protein
MIEKMDKKVFEKMYKYVKSGKLKGYSTSGDIWGGIESSVVEYEKDGEELEELVRFIEDGGIPFLSQDCRMEITWQSVDYDFSVSENRIKVSSSFFGGHSVKTDPNQRVYDFFKSHFIKNSKTKKEEIDTVDIEELIAYKDGIEVEYNVNYKTENTYGI